MARIRLRLLGGFEIFDSSDQTIQLSVKKAKALLVYLATQSQIRFSREQLAEFFWPKAVNDRARHSLRQAIADLRKHIPDFDEIINVSHNSLQAKGENIDLDLHRFDQLVKQQDPQAFQKAYEIYRGHFLDGFNIKTESFTNWCKEVTQTVREQYMNVIESLSEHQLLEGNSKAAISLSQQLVKIDPLRESTHRNLMSLFAKQGDIDAAIEQYRHCCRLLKIHLNTEPESQTKNIYTRIKQRAASSGIDVTQSDPTTHIESNQENYLLAECIGRENEMNILCSCIEHTFTTKQGQCIVVSGDDGVGKSYLLSQASKFAQQLEVAVAKTHFFDVNSSDENGIRELIFNITNTALLPDNSDIPVYIATQFFDRHPKYDLYLAALYSMLDFQLPIRLLGKYTALKPATREQLIKTVIIEIITRVTSKSPLLVILDDSHYMTASMQLIEHALIDLTNQLPIILVSVTNQKQDRAPNHIIAETKNRLFTSINMPPLDKAHTARIFPELNSPQCGDLLYLSWLKKLPNHAEIDPPERLIDVLNQINSSLNEQDRSALDIATVLGLRFDLEVLRTLLDAPHYEPTNLIQHGYLHFFGHMLEFTHRITQQTLYESLENKQRAEIHFKAASYFLFGNTQLHAYHLDAAGSTDAAKAYLSAALSANNDFKPDLAIHFYEKASECAKDNHEKYFSAIHKGDLLLESERIALAVQSYDQAQNFASNQQEQTLAWLGMAIGLIEREQYTAARSLLERCEPELAKSSDHEIQTKLYYYLAKTLYHLNNTESAVRYNKIAFEYAKQAGKSYWQAKIALSLGIIAFKQLHLTKAFSDLSFALRLARENRHDDLEIQILTTLAKVKLFKADFQGSASDLDYVMNTASMIEDHKSVLEILCVLCLLDFYKGQFARLQQHTELATELCHLIGSTDKDNHIASYQLLAAYHTNNQHQQQRLIKEIQNNIDTMNITSSFVLAPIMALTETAAEDARGYLMNAKNTLSRLAGPDALECSFLSIEAAIHHQLWDIAIDIADNLIMLIKDEPLHFFIMCAERVRILSQIAQDDLTETIRTELVDIFASAKHVGLGIHLPAYEVALNQLRDPIKV